MNRSLAAIAVAEAAIIAVLMYLLVAGREGARGDRSRVPETSAAEHAPVVAEPAVGVGTAPSPVTAAASPPATQADAVLWGKVVDGSGSSRQGIGCVGMDRVLRQGTGQITLRTAGGDARTVQILKGGWYATAGLAPGPWTAKVSVPGWKEEVRSLQLAGGTCRLDFVLQALTGIAVRFVTPAGTPLIDELRNTKSMSGCPLHAVATKEPPPARLPMTYDPLLAPYGAGEWVSTNLPKGVDGLLLVGEPFPLHVSVALKHVILQTKVIAAPAEEIVFTLRPDEVLANLVTAKARFVDATTGEPIKGARASLDDRWGGPDAKTDDDGRVVLAQGRPGLMVLWLMASGYEGFRAEVPIRPGGEIDLGTFRIAPAATVEGRVVDPDGKPVPWCSILACNLEHLATPRLFPPFTSHQTDVNGAFAIRNAGRAQYLIVTSARAWAIQAQVLDLRSGDATAIEIRLRPGALVSVVSKLPRDRPCRIMLLDGAGTTYAASLSQWEGVSYRLAPGAYRLTVRDDDGVVQELPFDVGTTPLTLEIGR